MGFDPELLKHLIETFKLELEEQLQILTDGLLHLEKTSLEESGQTDCFNTIFRAAHNIKGASRSLNINDVADIAHHIESIFSSVQKKAIVLTPSVINLCFEAVDKMRIAMQFFLENQPVPFNLMDLLGRLEQGEAIKTKSKKNPIKIQPVTVNVEKETTVSVAHTHIEHETIRVSIESLDRITALMEDMQVNKIAIVDLQERLAKLAANTKHLTHLWQQTKVTENSFLIEDGENFQKLYNSNDLLMKINHSTHELHTDMRLRVNELNALSHSLQQELRMLRLIPAENLLQFLPRMVRDLAQDMEKKVELHMTGADVKIDKMLLERLKDPLSHLLRNAIDHGIEPPSVRKTLGKPEIGHIWLDLSEEGNQILIQIKDDGTGIDINKIREICEKKHLLTQSELSNMTETGVLELIFRPGFSTRDIITTISGRGVGLNVVKENITHLKGYIGVTTELGVGTTFELHVPLSLTSERGLIVRSGGQLFVIPTASVQHVLSLEADSVVEVGASQAILIDEHPIPLRTLADILNLEKQETLLINKLPTIVIQKGKHTVAFLVEAIEGEREIVVKPLQAPLNNIQGIAGGTLSGSGQVMIVLNSSDLMSMALQGKRARVSLQDDMTKTRAKPHILVVDDSITTRTLEKNILENQGYQVTIAVDGNEAWNALQKQTFSLLITDVMMPNVDGFTLTERVKKTKKLQNMPVIIVTSLGSEKEKKRGIEVGADAYIVKNEFESGALLDIVAQLV